ncbi:ribonuclease inhibitor isoform X1 [Pelodiscus sinensis]|uniref:ribonuclease inhibitor isoform X1 n=2 Tax=Pelodiscus sinensis TaxID=13735 RepID=UPI003F6CE05F
MGTRFVPSFCLRRVTCFWIRKRGTASAFKMDLDIQCEELSASRWTELVLSMNTCKTVRLDDCSLSANNCKDIGSVLSSNKSLTELTLNNNELGDSGVELLCKGLMAPSCNLQKLWLQNCNLTDACCKHLRSVLSTKPSLIELHLGDNKLKTSGVKVLCEGLLDPNCQLQKLQLEYCELKPDICELLCTALRTKSSLKMLNLSNNRLGDPAIKLLCQGLMDPNCKLQSLHVENCHITTASCGDLSAVLASKPCLTDLSVGENKIGDAGLALLCQGLLNPTCQIEKLWLWECGLTPASCKDLAQVLRTKESLTEVSLIGNDLGDAGMEQLCQGLKDPKAKLQALWIRECGFTTACCKSLSSALGTNQTLRELHMGGNKVGDAGVEIIHEGLMSPNCNLRSLWLGNCDLSAACCGHLATIISSKQCLTELDLSNNALEDEGVKKLCEALRQPGCKLQQLVLYDIYWSSETDDELKVLEESIPGLKIVS